jgi:hypothetical protein
VAVEVSNYRRIIRGRIAKTWIAGLHNMENGSTRAKKLGAVWNGSGRNIPALTSQGHPGKQYGGTERSPDGARSPANEPAPGDGGAQHCLAAQ